MMILITLIFEATICFTNQTRYINRDTPPICVGTPSLSKRPIRFDNHNTKRQDKVPMVNKNPLKYPDNVNQKIANAKKRTSEYFMK